MKIENMAYNISPRLGMLWFACPIVGILIAFKVIMIRLNKADRKKYTAKAKGKYIKTVLSREVHSGGTDKVPHTFYAKHIVVEYYDEKGIRRECVSDGGFQLPKGKTEIEVRYNPQNSQDAYIEGRDVYINRVLAIIAAVTFLIIIVFLFIPI